LCGFLNDGDFSFLMEDVFLKADNGVDGDCRGGGVGGIWSGDDLDVYADLSLKTGFTEASVNRADDDDTEAATVACHLSAPSKVYGDRESLCCCKVGVGGAGEVAVAAIVTVFVCTGPDFAQFALQLYPMSPTLSQLSKMI
jgi:hypothetical protein